MLALEVLVDFEFCCCTCGNNMGVTLKCEGKGLAGGLDTIASVKVPCPTCGNHNKMDFTPGGTLHGVTADGKKRIPEPSLN